MSIRERQHEDLPQVALLLETAGLPPDGLDRTQGWVAEEGGAVLGHVAVELTADAAVVRSLVVHTSQRGRGIAGALLREAESLAGARSIVLRTDTIGAWMERRGYVRTTLDQVPASVRGTTQFEGQLCSGYPILAKPAGKTFSQAIPDPRESVTPDRGPAQGCCQPETVHPASACRC